MVSCGGRSYAGWLDRQLEQVMSHPVGGVSCRPGFFQVITQYWAHAEPFDCFEIGHDLAGALQRVFSLQFVRKRGAIDQGIIKDLRLRMVVKNTDVIRGG